MKKLHQIILLNFLLFCGACKKSDQLQVVDKPRLAVAAADVKPVPLTVTTIAGQYNVDGFKDGTGADARFDFPQGIDITDDGTLYVADLFVNAIRKISPAGVVTTLNIPPSQDGQTLLYPHDVVVTKDGTVNILAYYDLTPANQHKFWILQPSGQLLTPASQVNYYTYRYYNITKDPFSNYLQISGERFVTTASGHRQGFIESAEIENNIIGKHPYSPPLDSLNTPSREASAVTQIFCGYNGVKYLVIRSKFVYKLTPSGVFTRIFRDFSFHEIQDLITNKDSRTVYLIDQGAIVSISNNKLTKLVGLTSSSTFSHPDGVGAKAYVFANFMVLSKDENTIYFTDNYAVRKLTLK